jgi:hypothetical protein
MVGRMTLGSFRSADMVEPRGPFGRISSAGTFTVKSGSTDLRQAMAVGANTVTRPAAGADGADIATVAESANTSWSIHPSSPCRLSYHAIRAVLQPQRTLGRYFFCALDTADTVFGTGQCVQSYVRNTLARYKTTMQSER